MFLVIPFSLYVKIKKRNPHLSPLKLCAPYPFQRHQLDNKKGHCHLFPIKAYLTQNLASVLCKSRCHRLKCIAIKSRKKNET